MKNNLWQVQVQNANDRAAEFSEQFCLFDQHKKDLLKALARGCTRSGSGRFDKNKAWRDLRQAARLYFSAQALKQQTLPPTSRRRQLAKLARALRHSKKLSLEALDGDVGIDLYRAIAGDVLPLLQIDKDGSSALSRKADSLKGMVEAITTLEKLARAALQSVDAPAAAGRTMLFPRDCIQGLGRIYYENTGASPGRGLGGPFSDFAHEFFLAVGLNEFAYDSLVEAIKDAHRRHKNSWLGKTR